MSDNVDPTNWHYTLLDVSKEFHYEKATHQRVDDLLMVTVPVSVTYREKREVPGRLLGFIPWTDTEHRKTVKDDFASYVRLNDDWFNTHSKVNLSQLSKCASCPSWVHVTVGELEKYYFRLAVSQEALDEVHKTRETT